MSRRRVVVQSCIILVACLTWAKCATGKGSLQRGDSAGGAPPPSTGGAGGEAVVLWWTPFTGIMGQSRNCGLGSCFFTEDRSYLHNKRLKAVLFYGSDFSIEDLPLPRQSRHWWGLLHEESPKNQPLFDHQPVLQLFNITSTFRRGSNFPLTLQHLKSIEALTSTREFVPTKEKNHLLGKESLAPVVYVQSDCDTPAQRDKYVSELAKYIKIDSYGACLHNRDLPAHLQDPAGTYNHGDFRALVAKYKFAIAIENAGCDDYITEKLWRPLTLGTVPVYWGSPTVRDWEPNPHSVIVVSDFQTPKELAVFLHRLLENDTLYESYLKHKLNQEVTNAYLLETMEKRRWGIDNDFEKGNFIEHFECHVCDQVLTRHSGGRSRANPGEFQADLSHYGCPEPETVLGEDEEARNFWVEQWNKARVEAQVLHRLVSLPPKRFTPDEFFDAVIPELQRDGFFQRFPPEHEEL